MDRATRGHLTPALGTKMSSILRNFSRINIDRLSDLSISYLEKLSLHDVASIKIFYCFQGRNAWHSTWICRYYDNCMHLTLESAQKYAESMRKSGSVFYIYEIPALLLDSQDYAVVVTQINEDCPLRYYSEKAVRKNGYGAKEKVDKYSENYIVLGSPMDRLVYSFLPGSRFWKVQQPIKNSIIFLYTRSQENALLLRQEKLKAWKSYSMGNDCYLGWNPIENYKVSSKSVRRIFKRSCFNTKNNLNA